MPVLALRKDADLTGRVKVPLHLQRLLKSSRNQRWDPVAKRIVYNEIEIDDGFSQFVLKLDKIQSLNPRGHGVYINPPWVEYARYRVLKKKNRLQFSPPDRFEQRVMRLKVFEPDGSETPHRARPFDGKVGSRSENGVPESGQFLSSGIFRFLSYQLCRCTKAWCFVYRL